MVSAVSSVKLESLRSSNSVQSVNSEQKIRDFIRKYKLNPFYSSTFTRLSDYQIVILVDNGAAPVPKELDEGLVVLQQLGAIYNQCEVFYLQEHETSEPIPMAAKLQDIFCRYRRHEKLVKLIVLTDRLPVDVQGSSALGKLEVELLFKQRETDLILQNAVAVRFAVFPGNDAWDYYADLVYRRSNVYAIEHYEEQIAEDWIEVRHTPKYSKVNWAIVLTLGAPKIAPQIPVSRSCLIQ